MFPQFPHPLVRSHIDNLLDLYVGMSQCTLEAAQRLSALNLQLGRELIAEAGASTARMLASQGAGQFGSAVIAQFTPGSQAIFNYQRGVAEVLSRCQALASQTAADRMPAVRRSATAMADDLLQEASRQTAQAAEQLARFQPGSQLRH
jgi:phasin family protein